MSEEYDKIREENEWDNALEEWKDFVEENDRHDWKRVD
jgi:hypothetical protein